MHALVYTNTEVRYGRLEISSRLERLDMSKLPYLRTLETTLCKKFELAPKYKVRCIRYWYPIIYQMID